MQRRRALEPDTIIETRTYGEVAIVSDRVFLETAMAFAQLQTIAGGVVTQIVDRHPTDVPQEMVTTFAVFEWKDRTDAKAQPEAQTGVAMPAALDDPTPGELEEALEAEAEPDGLDPESLAEEDMDAIPAGQR
jgi:hypothetical protein